MQEVLDPVLRNLAFGEKNAITLFPEGGAYNFFIGAVSAGVMNSVSYTSGAIADRKNVNYDITLPSGTVVTSDAINNVMNARESDADRLLLAKLGEEMTPELLEREVSKIQNRANVDMGGRTYGDVMKEAAGLETSAERIDLYSDIINSEEYAASVEKYKNNALNDSVGNDTINNQSVEGLRNGNVEETRAVDGGRTAISDGIERLGEGFDRGVEKGRVLGQRNSIVPETTVVSYTTKQYVKEKTGRDFLPVLDSTTEYERYSSALQEAINTNEHGAYVSPQSVEDLKSNAKRTFLTPDNNAGVVVFNNGDIGALFKNPKLQQRSVSLDLVLTAIENGGNKLDNYDGYLTRNYTQFGFIPVARVAFNEQYAPENWNYEKFGKPDVIFFMHNGDSVETIAKNYRNYEKIDTSTLPLFEDYDQAYAYRDSLIEEKKQSNVKQKDSFEKGKDVIRHLTAARMAAEYGLQVQIIDNPNKDVHGYVSGDTVYLNRNSDKSILVTMVHELTHKTENTKFYKDIHTAAINWMHQTGVDMSAFRNSIAETYA